MQKNIVNKPLKLKIQQSLLNWYEKEKRDLPWRKTQDPYAIWVSEIMLQQTQVQTVIPYYLRWMKQFSTIQKLAKAKEQTVVKAWEGLGYYSRARNLHKASQLVCSQFNGSLPSNEKELSTLPGIGPYTLGALLSIAFNQPQPAVDGNVLRVFSRLFGIKKNIKDKNVINLITESIQKLQPNGKCNQMTQAWMELGALICTPSSPQCSNCPLISLCKANQNNLTDKLPIVTKRPKTIKIKTAALILRKNESVLLEKKPKGKVMGGLWVFPTIQVDHQPLEKLDHLFKKHLGIKIKVNKKVLSLKHSYTIYQAQLHVYQGEILRNISSKKCFEWIDLKELSKYPFPSVHTKIVTFIQT